MVTLLIVQNSITINNINTVKLNLDSMQRICKATGGLRVSGGFHFVRLLSRHSVLDTGSHLSETLKPAFAAGRQVQRDD